MIKKKPEHLTVEDLMRVLKRFPKGTKIYSVSVASDIFVKHMEITSITHECDKNVVGNIVTDLPPKQGAA